MQKGDAVAVDAPPGRFVHETVSGGAAPRERGVQVRDAVADVMDARTAPRKELGNRPPGVARLEQLDMDVAKTEAHDRRTVGRFRGPRHETQHVPIEREGVGNAGYRDADVGDLGMCAGGGHTVILTTRKGSGSIMTELHLVAVTDATFESEVEKQTGLTLVDFWATWCGPCTAVAPIMQQLAGEYAGRVKVAKMDVDENQRTTMRFNVRSIPSVLFFKDGRHIDTVVGAYPKPVFDQKIQQHIS